MWNNIFLLVNEASYEEIAFHIFDGPFRGESPRAKDASRTFGTRRRSWKQWQRPRRVTFPRAEEKREDLEGGSAEGENSTCVNAGGVGVHMQRYRRRLNSSMLLLARCPIKAGMILQVFRRVLPSAALEYRARKPREDSDRWHRKKWSRGTWCRSPSPRDSRGRVP